MGAVGELVGLVPRLRLGAALVLPPPVADEVQGLRRALEDPSLGRVPPHLTLIPPVNVAAADLPTALAVMRAAAGATGPELEVALGAPTSFLPANPVLYLPVVGGADAVVALRRRMWQAPLIRELTWPFVPHVTLANDASPGRIDAAVTALAGFGARVVFRRINLLVERHPGPHWVPLADAAFGPPAVVSRGGPLALELTRSVTIDPEALALLAAEGARLAGPVAGGAAAAAGPAPVAGGGAGPAAAAAPGSAPVAGGAAGSAGRVRGGIVVTGRREGEVVGVAVGWFSPSGCERDVYVAERHRRQGIGRHLEAALESALAEGTWDGDADH